MGNAQSGETGVFPCAAFMVVYDKIGTKNGGEIEKMTKFARLQGVFAGND